MSKRVLLTGISGFAGSHVLEHILVNTDWEVIGIASWKHKGTPERIEEVMEGHPEWKDRLTIITHDLQSPMTAMTKKRIGVCNYVLNLASESHVDRSINEPVPFIQNNVNLVLNMLEFAREYKPDVFLQFSTDEVLGPAPEGIDFKEWSTPVPSNPYSASKEAQEAIAISYWRTYGVPLIITNTMNLFGQMQDPEKYVAQLIAKISSGEIVTVHGSEGHIGSRYYLHARNMSDALLFILNNCPPTSYTIGEVMRPDRYNIVGDKELNNLEMAQLVASLLNKPLVYALSDFHSVRPGHDYRYALDGSKLKNLGWKAPLLLEESIRDTINWTIDNPIWK